MITGYRNIVEKLPDGSTMPLADLLGPLPDELKPLCRELQPKVEALNENEVRGHFEIGQILKREIPRIEAKLQTQGRSCYGTHLFEHLGVQFDTHPRILRDCAEVADRFTPAQYDARIVRPGLTWSHARLLAKVPHPIQRESLIDRAIAERLSAKDLGGLIVGDAPTKPRGPGRSPAKPRNLRQGLDRLGKLSKTFENTMAVLFGEEFDIPSEIAEAAPDALTPEIRAVVAECAGQLAAIEQTVKNARSRLKAGLERIDACIAAQTEQAKKDQAEEDETHGRRNGRRTPAHAC